VESFNLATSLALKPVLVGDGEREAVVDADDGRGVRREFLAKPLGKTAPSPVPAWTGWGSAH
jgi:hypothetical protein